MARKKKWQPQVASPDEESLFWFMATAYVLSAVGLLDRRKESEFDSLDQHGIGRWKDIVRERLGVDDTFVHSVYALCVERRGPAHSIAFILRGLGCPNVEEQLSEFLPLT